MVRMIARTHISMASRNPRIKLTLIELCGVMLGRPALEDVAFLDSHIPEIRIGDDRVGIVTIPGIGEMLEVVGYSEGEPPLGDVLTDHKRFIRKERTFSK
jgi:hypothetical protein